MKEKAGKAEVKETRLFLADSLAHELEIECAVRRLNKTQLVTEALRVYFSYPDGDRPTPGPAPTRRAAKASA